MGARTVLVLHRGEDSAAGGFATELVARLGAAGFRGQRAPLPEVDTDTALSLDVAPHLLVAVGPVSLRPESLWELPSPTALVWVDLVVSDRATEPQPVWQYDRVLVTTEAAAEVARRLGARHIRMIAGGVEGVADELTDFVGQYWPSPGLGCIEDHEGKLTRRVGDFRAAVDRALEDRPRPSTASRSPIFIGGAGRSGTTLLRRMLDAHPNIACGGELKILPRLVSVWLEAEVVHGSLLRSYGLSSPALREIFADTISRLLEAHRLKTGKRRMAEKTPGNVRVFGPLHHLFPNSPLLHVVRDGRDVVCSLLRQEWLGPDGERAPFTTDPREAARYWVESVQAGRAAARASTSVAARYLEVRYEDLVTDPSGELHRVLSFIGEPWDDGVLRHHVDSAGADEDGDSRELQAVDSTSIGRWGRDLSQSDLSAVLEVAGSLLRELGYAEA